MTSSALKKILVIAAHPDDEMLGCGGTLARLRAQQRDISILLLGEGPTSRGFSQKASVKANANSSATKAAQSLDITDVRFLSLPDNKFDTVPLLDIVQQIEKVKAEIEPDLILTHHAGDMNIDHRITHQAVMTAFRPLPGEKAVSILGFEVLSSTEYAPINTLPAFLPNVFVNITGYLLEKLATLGAYQSEMRPWPHPRSFQGVEHLAHLRGCQCGCEAAEAFMLLRSVL